MKSTVTIEVAQGVDPFGHNTTRSKRTIWREFMGLVKKCINTGVLGRNASRPVAIAGLVQAQAVVTCAAVANADTVTVNGQALTATQANSRGTITCASVSAADTATVNGVVFTAVNGGTPTSAQFDMSGSDTACAASLVSAVNASIDALLSGVITAANAAGVVTFRAVTAGTAGNSLSLATSNNTRLAKSGTALTGGAAVANNQFDFGGTDTQTGAALAAALNASTTAILSGVIEATAAAGGVTVKCRHKGKVGNSITIATSNGTRLAITGSVSRLAGGTQTSYTF